MDNSMRARFFKLTLALALVLAVLVPSTPAQAAGLVSTCDEPHLLAAISGGGLVTFVCDGTITLASQVTLDGSTSLTLDGAGHEVILSGGGLTRLFEVGPYATLNLTSLTLTNGYFVSLHQAPLGGGAVYNRGTLNIRHVTFSNNLANFDMAYGGAIYNDSGVMAIDASTFMDNATLGSQSAGGAIYSYGFMTILNCTFTGNAAHGSSSFGGAISAGGPAIGNNIALITGSTFSGNSAPYFGGALAISTGGELINNTFMGNFTYDPTNSIGGAIFTEGASLTIANSTFWKNSAQTHGGAIYNIGLLTLRNNVFADSLAGGNCYGGLPLNDFIDGGGNLHWNALDPADHSCPGVTGDPKLGPLANYGGLTQTLRLLPGSAAIRLARANCPPLDQRGYPRPAPVCDSGAFELGQFYLPLVVQSTGQGK